MRAQPGDQIEIFDGRGQSSAAIVQTIQKRFVLIRLLGERQIDPPSVCETVLAVAVPKGDRWGWMIEKVTELGVDRFIPLSTFRSVVHPRDQKLHKGEQISLAACKQSGRNRELTIEPICPLHELLRRPELKTALIQVGCPGGKSPASICSAGTCNSTLRIGIVGPEGGLTADEMQAIEAAGGKPVSLSPFVLRIETAAVAFAAWFATLPRNPSDPQL